MQTSLRQCWTMKIFMLKDNVSFYIKLRSFLLICGCIDGKGNHKFIVC